MKFTSGNLHLVFVSTPNLDEKAAFGLQLFCMHQPTGFGLAKVAGRARVVVKGCKGPYNFRSCITTVMSSPPHFFFFTAGVSRNEGHTPPLGGPMRPGIALL